MTAPDPSLTLPPSAPLFLPLEVTYKYGGLVGYRHTIFKHTHFLEGVRLTPSTSLKFYTQGNLTSSSNSQMKEKASSNHIVTL